MPSPGDWILSVAKRLVNQPDAATTSWAEETGTVTVFVAPSDRGKLIGRRGRTIDSLRIVANTFFGSNNKRIDVKLSEE